MMEKEYKIERFTFDMPIDAFMEKYYDGRTSLQKCRECPSFAKTWSCPDFDFDTADHWREFKTYRIICDKIFMDGITSPAEAAARLSARSPVFDREMLALEKAVPGSEALCSEECEICSVCARLAGEPCRFPEIMRYSIEALGGRAVDLIKDVFDFDVIWSDGESVPEYYILLGGLLLK